MRWAEQPGTPRWIGAALAVLLVAQLGAATALHRRPRTAVVAAACGAVLPPADAAHPFDVGLQLERELTVGGTSDGTVTIVNRGRGPLVVLTTQAVLVAPAAPAPVAPPEDRRAAGVLLRPGQFLRQRLSLVARPCPGATLGAGFYEIALVVVIQPDGGRPRSLLAARRATSVRPG